MTEGERKYTGFARLHQLEQERLRREAEQWEAPISLEEFRERWGGRLARGGKAGKLKICEVVYENTYGAGRKTFIVGYGKLAEMCGLSKSMTKANVKQLEEMGLLERLNIYNTATKQGSEYRLHFEPILPEGSKGLRE